MNKVISKKVAALLTAAALVVGFVPSNVQAASYGREGEFEVDYTINNPYEEVNWNTYGQYKGDFHVHSKNSDGGNWTYEMVEDHYAKGYDILAMTDHNYVTRGWENAGKGSMTAQRKAEIEAGVGRDGRGMLDFSYGNEQSMKDHINTFGIDWNNPAEGSSMDLVLNTNEQLGGVAHINHMGRYTGSSKIDYADYRFSNDPAVVSKYVNLLRANPSTVGVEIINKLDNESRLDRPLYDNILMELMPEGRNVWGFSNDDTHAVKSTGYAFNMLLMPELNAANTKKAMKDGAFYAVSRISREDGINATFADGTPLPGSGNDKTLYLLDQTTPSISNIVVDQEENSISITGANYNTIEWIADGKVIATGNEIDLNDYEDVINSYVRAQLKSETGIAFTQPFGIKEETEELEITSVETKNKQVRLNFDIESANGKGYYVYASKDGKDFQLCEDVNFNSKGVHIRGLQNGCEYTFYVVRVIDGVVVERSKAIVARPGK